MFRPVALFIGLRYTRAKRRNHFISFISLMSMLGIALGVLVLITVLSVMNGFDREIKARVFSMIPAMSVGSYENYLADWQPLEKKLVDIPGVRAVAPFVTGQVLINYNGFVQPVMINGILPKQEKNITAIAEKMTNGHLDLLVPRGFGIILGQELADNLGAHVGDKVTVVTPDVSVSVAGVVPRYKRFTVVGIFRAGSGFGFDRGLAFIHLNDAQTLFSTGEAITAVRVNMLDPFKANLLAEQLTKELPMAKVSTWAQQFGEFFHAISLEKSMMFFILLLLVAVAVFNLVSTLVMVVNEKQSDIAILRTYGATPRMIMAIFFVQGAVIGIVGTLLGLVGGVLLALNATQLVAWIEQLFHVHFISSNVYFVNYLPSQLLWSDVLHICFVALLLSLLATLYPAWRASRTEPVEALRYE